MPRRKRYYLVVHPEAARAAEMRHSLPAAADDDDLRKQKLAVRLRARITLPRVSIQPENWRKL